jgi:hypothetical protein
MESGYARDERYMRIKLAVVLLLVVGAALAADLLLGNKTLSSLQLAQVKTACPSCHSRPAFTSADSVHARHPQVDCTFCHPANPPEVDFDACKSCHSVPSYTSASAMHDVHDALNCSRCHRDTKGLRTTDSLRNTLKRLCIGIMLFGLGVIIANFIIVHGRTKVK